MTPWTIMGGALGGLLLLIAAYAYGRHDGTAITNARYLAAAEQARKDQKKLDDLAAKLDAKAAEEGSKTQTIIQEKIREIPKIISTNPGVYNTPCFDDNGLRALRESLEAGNRETIGGSDSQAAGDTKSSSGLKGK